MDSIIITRPVVVKVRVTEKYKAALLQQIEYSIRRLDLELARLERRTGPGGGERTESEPQLEGERRKQSEARRKLLEQARDVRLLQPGNEVVHGRLESVARLHVGDNWQKLMGVEVLVEDGRVVEIRSRSGGMHDD